MRTKKRLHPYVTRDVEHRLESYCAATGITVSAFIEGAIEERLKGEPKDLEVILRRLDRQDRTAAARQREQTVLMESLAAFVRIWFAHQPPIADADKPGAERLSAQRYQQFIDFVCRQLAGGSGFGAEVAKSRVGQADSATTEAPNPLPGSRDAQR
jgi:hypothetical protein